MRTVKQETWHSTVAPVGESSAASQFCFQERDSLISDQILSN